MGAEENQQEYKASIQLKEVYQIDPLSGAQRRVVSAAGHPVFVDPAGKCYEQLPILPSPPPPRPLPPSSTYATLMSYPPVNGSFSLRSRSGPLPSSQALERKQQNRRTNNAHTLLKAAKEGDVAKIRQLLSLGPDCDPNYQDHRGRTALMLAARDGQYDTVNLLLADQRVNQALTDNAGYTALMRATSRRHHSVMARLLANPQAINIDALSKAKADEAVFQKTALDIAINSKDGTAINLLLDAGATYRKITLVEHEEHASATPDETSDATTYFSRF